MPTTHGEGVGTILIRCDLFSTPKIVYDETEPKMGEKSLENGSNHFPCFDDHVWGQYDPFHG